MSEKLQGIVSPSIDNLLSKVTSKYELVIFASKRARQINDYYNQLGEGLGRIVPGVTDATHWPYELVGAGYGLLGVGFMLLAHVRMRVVEAAVDRGEFARLDARWSLMLLISGAILGLAAVALVVLIGSIAFSKRLRITQSLRSKASAPDRRKSTETVSPSIATL